MKRRALTWTAGALPCARPDGRVPLAEVSRVAGKPERGRASRTRRQQPRRNSGTTGRARRPRYPGIDHTGHGRRLTRSTWLPTGRYRRLPLTVTPPVRHTRVTRHWGGQTLGAGDAWPKSPSVGRLVRRTLVRR